MCAATARVGCQDQSAEKCECDLKSHAVMKRAWLSDLHMTLCRSVDCLCGTVNRECSLCFDRLLPRTYLSFKSYC